jgi:hypothetical protein
MTRLRKILLVVGGLVVVTAAVGTSLLMAGHHTQMLSAGSMTSKASQVMPFDLVRTTHTFVKAESGGVEKVVVKDPADTRNQTLIRSHLGKEAALFRTGNYSDPTMIHGMDMPGVKELAAGADRVTVDYAEVSGGAQIAFSSADPALVSAIHAWFDRQVADHGMPGMGG